MAVIPVGFQLVGAVLSDVFMFIIHLHVGDSGGEILDLVVHVKREAIGAVPTNRHIGNVHGTTYGQSVRVSVNKLYGEATFVLALSHLILAAFIRYIMPT